MAAGPGIPPRDKRAPLRAARSAANYPHLVARRLGLDLVDVTYSGATTAHVLTERQNNEPPQVAALDGTEALVTITIGGNDVGYIPLLTAAALPRAVRSVPVLGSRLRELLDPTARDRELVNVEEALKQVGRAARERAPRARVLFVDYLTLLPPAGEDASPLSGVEAALGRRIAATLERLTSEAAAETGCDLVRASDASREHHAWSADPWTTKPSKFGIPVPGRAFPAHANAAGMRAVADLVVAQAG
jgi:lysophospholipase L1-like esterase